MANQASDISKIEKMTQISYNHNIRRYVHRMMRMQKACSWNALSNGRAVSPHDPMHNFSGARLLRSS